jgi:HSP20 family protein
MSIMRWDPFHELNEIQTRLGKLFDDRFTRFDDGPKMQVANWAPAVDIQETDKEYLIKADLPEVKREDVRVQVQDGVLTLEGERRSEKEEKGKKFHRIEREYGQFVRRFVVPAGVDDTKVAAEFKDGVLNVRLPKSETAKPKSVDVKVA